MPSIDSAFEAYSKHNFYHVYATFSVDKHPFCIPSDDFLL